MQYEYKSVWGGYAYDDENRFATDKELESCFSEINLAARSCSASGIPLRTEGNRCIVNNETLHTIVFGESGCKKTRSLVLPALASMIMAKESIFVTDVKGEIYSNPVIRELLEANGYETPCLDFRSFQGDGYDVLEYPFSLYKAGEKDEALAFVSQFVSDIRNSYGGSPKDPYWDNCAEQLLNALIHIFFEIAVNNPKYSDIANLLSVASFASGSALEDIADTIEGYFSNTKENSMLMLKSLVDLPNNTRACVGSCTGALLKDYVRQKSLTKMLSKSTFDVTTMYEKPACVFLIIPDETTSYDNIAGLLLDCFYNRLIKQFSEKYQNKRNPPRRINFMVDEFCNVHISDMSGKISASRSRMMRWYLFCQSKAQLENAYEKEGATIIGNCKNVVFLQSSDPKMLSFISDLCGKTRITEGNSPEPLVPEDKLRTLKQTHDFKEGIFIRGDFKYHMMLPDFERYRFAGIKGKRIPKTVNRLSEVNVRCFTPADFNRAIIRDRVAIPFAS